MVTAKVSTETVGPKLSTLANLCITSLLGISIIIAVQGHTIIRAVNIQIFGEYEEYFIIQMQTIPPIAD